MIIMITAEMSAMMMMMIIITVVSKDRMKENGQPTFESLFHNRQNYDYELLMY